MGLESADFMKKMDSKKAFWACGTRGDRGRGRLPMEPAMQPSFILSFYTDVQGWISYKEGSVNGSRYVTIHKPMTFYGAQDACRDQGGHLAHINSIREQVFIEEYLKQIIGRNSEYSLLAHALEQILMHEATHERALNSRSLSEKHQRVETKTFCFPPHPPFTLVSPDEHTPC